MCIDSPVRIAKLIFLSSFDLAKGHPASVASLYFPFRWHRRGIDLVTRCSASSCRRRAFCRDKCLRETWLDGRRKCPGNKAGAKGGTKTRSKPSPDVAVVDELGGRRSFLRGSAACARGTSLERLSREMRAEIPELPSRLSLPMLIALTSLHWFLIQDEHRHGCREARLCNSRCSTSDASHQEILIT